MKQIDDTFVNQIKNVIEKYNLDKKKNNISVNKLNEMMNNLISLKDQTNFLLKENEYLEDKVLKLKSQIISKEGSQEY